MQYWAVTAAAGVWNLASGIWHLACSIFGSAADCVAGFRPPVNGVYPIDETVSMVQRFSRIAHTGGRETACSIEDLEVGGGGRAGGFIPPGMLAGTLNVPLAKGNLI